MVLCSEILSWAMSVGCMPLHTMPSQAARRVILPACASFSSTRMGLPPLLLARMRLPGSAGLLSLLGVAGPGTTFFGALFHGMAGSGDVVQHDPVGDSNTMELAAVLWALVWVVISCPPCSVCIATDSMFSCNVVEALWSVGGHAQLACLCSPMLLIARQVADVCFEHVKAHEGNPFNELADGLAKKAAGGADAPLPVDVARLLVCSSSVAWEWLHGMPPRHEVLTPRCGMGLSSSARSGLLSSLAVSLRVTPPMLEVMLLT